MSYRASVPRHDLPQWWRETRSMYCPACCVGAGSDLMQFGGLEVHEAVVELDEALPTRIRSFLDLPLLLEEARAVGSSLLYLVDYWESGYLIKGDYLPRSDLGGPAALREGVKRVHDGGGRVILYLEPHIVSREASAIGRERGAEWAMMNPDGSYQRYWGSADGYYQMWPGRGSGWSGYLAGLAERMVREYDVDGFHLDSYGFEAGWKDYHPAHVDGAMPGEFDLCAASLVEELRGRVRAAKRDAIVVTEGSDREDIVLAADGSHEWTLARLAAKPWARDPGVKIFLSEYSLPQMESILAQGRDLSIARWWSLGMPTEAALESLRDTDLGSLEAADTDPGNEWWSYGWRTRRPVRDLWWCHNTLWANGRLQPRDIDMEWLRRVVPPFPFPIDASIWSREGMEIWRQLTRIILGRMEGMDLANARTPAEYLRIITRRAEKGKLAI